MNIIVGLGLLLIASLSFAPEVWGACIEEREEVKIELQERTFDDDENEFVTKKEKADLTGYSCSIDGKKVKVRFHVLSSVAAGMLLGEGPVSSTVGQMFGTYKLVSNPVSELYKGIFEKFSDALSLSKNDRYLAITFGGAASADFSHDNVVGETVRVLYEEEGHLAYPMVDELSSLEQRIVQPGVKFYYTEACAALDNETGECRKEGVTENFWRGMSREDIAEYPKKLQELNQSLGTQSGEDMPGDRGHSYFDLLKHISSNGMPEDFIILNMVYLREFETCDGEAGWDVTFKPRDMRLAIAEIANLSDQPLTLDGIFGTLISSPDFRPVVSAVSASGELVEIPSQTLAPRGSAIIPLRIEFPAPSLNLDDVGQAAGELHEKLGAGGLKTSGDYYGIPAPQDYAYGPELALSGLRIDGQRLDLTRRSANFVEVIASSEAGSCPYLLVWNQPARAWVSRGKILHDAKGKQHQEKEIVSFSGFQSRIRLEEREPELASIDEVALEVIRRDGTSKRLSAPQGSISSRDNDYLQLLWGDAVEVVFALPDDIAEDEVVESRLHITGYYQRYSEIKAAMVEHHPILGPQPSAKAPRMCPIPESTSD